MTEMSAEGMHQSVLPLGTPRQLHDSSTSPPPGDEKLAIVLRPRTAETTENSQSIPVSPLVSLEGDLSQESQINALVPIQDIPSLDLDQLEEMVEKGRQIIPKLQNSITVAQAAHGELKLLYAQLEDLKTRDLHHKSIIGVVGGTGVGKSSLINSLLDEEVLLPTDCMRACTAVVTEISYNHDTGKKYRAEIEFIERDDWKRELRILFNDLHHGAVRNKDSEAAIALAKLKAVYPGITREELLEATDPEIFLEKEPVKELLGTTVRLQENDGASFYPKLHRYLDNKKERRKEMEYWPLIKVVRIFCKSRVLSTGAILVDLPGSHDANVARAAVAERYMKNCTVLWIVAPITRAVDDKTAHYLLGETFRRQLLMDGGFSSVVFVCTKTDDISISEATYSLELEGELKVKTDKLAQMEGKMKEYENKEKLLKRSKTYYSNLQDDLDDQQDQWEDIKEKVERGETVYEPKPKRMEESKMIEFEAADGVSGEEGVERSNEDSGCSPLSDEQIQEKIAGLRAIRRQIRHSLQEVENNIEKIQVLLSKTKADCTKLRHEIAMHCIKARNLYATREIKQDFASGLRELDEESAEKRDPENFDPTVELRDYKIVAEQLPVFCVSSKGYQIMQGRLKKEFGGAHIFVNLEDTGLPALQRHCMTLTEKGREYENRRYLNTLLRITNSLSLWSMQENNSAALGLDGEVFVQFQKVLDEVVSNTVRRLRNLFDKTLYRRYFAGAGIAAEKAVATAATWRRLHWKTYQAVAVRDGVFFSPSAGYLNFNTDLTDPLTSVIAGRWERTFTKEVPLLFDSYSTACATAFEEFHSRIQSIVLASNCHFPQLEILKEQLPNYQAEARAIANDALALIRRSQKDVNRLAERLVTDCIRPAYSRCASESGAGCYARMKYTLENHVALHRGKMFDDCTTRVREDLQDMARSTKRMLEEATDDLFEQVEQDYRSLCGETGSPMYEEEKAALRSILEEDLTELRALERSLEWVSIG